MKKLSTIIVFVVLAFVGDPASAQVRAGLKAGWNLSGLHTWQGQSGTTMLPGYHAGLLSEADLSEKFFLRGELLYSMKGWGFPSTATYKSGSMNLHYITLPVLLGWSPMAKLSLLAGPEVGYRFRTIRKPAGSFSFHDVYQKWDLGIALGAGYALTSRLGAELRYSYAMKALWKATRTDENGYPIGISKDGHNHGLQLGFVYRWGKSR